MLLFTANIIQTGICQLAGKYDCLYDIDWNQSLYIHDTGSRDSGSRARQGNSASLASQIADVRASL